MHSVVTASNIECPICGTWVQVSLTASLLKHGAEDRKVTALISADSSKLEAHAASHG